MIAMAVTKWGELAVVPSRTVPMNDKLETKVLCHYRLRVVVGNEQLA
jgi:hypothetical protein